MAVRAGRALAVLLALLVALGCYFRVAHLDRKVYWWDETHTGFWISGYTRFDLHREAMTQGSLTPAKLEKYKSADPARGMGATLSYLKSTVPHHAPLYALLARAWAGTFGSSVTAMRALPALLSLLALPLMYWLCRELFDSRAVAWTAVVLLALSPFHVLYAQEARPYSLWTATTLLASAALLRALRLRTLPAWGLYALALALGLYSFLLFPLVLVAHGAHVLAREGLKPTRTVAAYAGATAIGFLAFTPWLVVLVDNWEAARRSTQWTRESVTASAWLRRSAYNLSVSLFDPGHDLSLWAAPALVLAIRSFVFLCRRASRAVWVFVLSLTGAVVLALALGDWTTGGKRMTVARYLVPAHLGVLLAVAHLLGTRLATPSPSPLRRGGSRALGLLVVAAGALSCAASARAETWWNKGGSPNRELARVINAAPLPAVLFDFNAICNVLSISTYVHPEVRFVPAESLRDPRALGRFRDVFLITPPDELRTGLERLGARVVPAHESRKLWRLERRKGR